MGVGEAQGRGKGIYGGKGVSVGLFLQGCINALGRVRVIGGFSTGLQEEGK